MRNAERRLRMLAAAGLSAILTVGSGLGPVSYTHLDVYKRQPFC